ncbi:hypothetical protein INR49_017425 [Caranx melampygus]|nr:hypothetical protein INR49_017425 [Caranx melampygus]
MVVLVLLSPASVNNRLLAMSELLKSNQIKSNLNIENLRLQVTSLDHPALMEPLCSEWTWIRLISKSSSVLNDECVVVFEDAFQILLKFFVSCFILFLFSRVSLILLCSAQTSQKPSPHVMQTSRTLMSQWRTC